MIIISAADCIYKMPELFWYLNNEGSLTDADSLREKNY